MVFHFYGALRAFDSVPAVEALDILRVSTMVEEDHGLLAGLDVCFDGVEEGRAEHGCVARGFDAAHVDD